MTFYILILWIFDTSLLYPLYHFWLASLILILSSCWQNFWRRRSKPNPPPHHYRALLHSLLFNLLATLGMIFLWGCRCSLGVSEPGFVFHTFWAFLCLGGGGSTWIWPGHMGIGRPNMSLLLAKLWPQTQRSRSNVLYDKQYNIVWYMYNIPLQTHLHL